MGTLRGRPLACAALLFAGVGVLYVLFPVGLFGGFFSLVLFGIAALGLAGLAARRLVTGRAGTPLCRYTALLLAFLLAALAWFSFFDGVWRRPIRTFAAEAAGEPVLCRGLVLDVAYEAVYASVYRAEVTLPNGRRTDAVVEVDGRGGLAVGDRFIASAVVTPLQLQAKTEEEDDARRYLAEGCLLTVAVSDAEDIAVTEQGVFTLRIRLQRAQAALSEYIRTYVGGDAGELTAALLVGDRSGLSRGTVLDFRRTGTSHLLALSGFHLTVLVGLLEWVLRLLRLPYFLRKSIQGVWAVGYCLLTGGHVSTWRATVMLLLLFLSRAVGRRNDAVTVLALFTAGATALHPEAVYDMGMWLSVLATFAMVEIAPRLVEVKTELKPGRVRLTVGQRIVSFLYRHTLLPLGTTVCVLFVTALPLWAAFGQFSVLSPLSTLLLTPFVLLLLTAGLFLLPVAALGWQSAAEGLGTLLGKAGKCMLSLTHETAQWRGIVLPAGTWQARLFGGLLCVLLFAVLAFRWKKPRRAACWLAGWALCFCLVNQGVYWAEAGIYTSDCAVSATGESEVLFFCEQNGAVLLDFTDGSYTAYAALLQDRLPRFVTEVRAVCLTHYHKRHVETLQKLADVCLVRSLWLPIPAGTDSEADQTALSVARTLLSCFEGSHTEVHFYVPAEGAELWDGFWVDALWNLSVPRSTHPVLGVKVHCSDTPLTLSWVGFSFWEAEGSETALTAMADSRILLLGGHGPVCKTPSGSISAWQNLDTVFYNDVNALSYFRLSLGQETKLLPYSALSAYPWKKIRE